MKLDFRQGEIILVSWVDAKTATGWQARNAEFIVPNPRSVGFFMRANEAGIWIAMTEDPTDIEGEEVADVLFIPAGCILKAERVLG